MNGSTTAFSEMYSTCAEEAYLVAFYSLKGKKDAEGAVYKACAEAFFNTVQLKDEQAFRMRFMKCVVEKIMTRLSEYKKLGIVVEYSVVDEEIGSYGIDMKQEINVLPPFERLVFSLSVICEFNKKQIAQLTQHDENTVAISLQNAKNMLTRRLLKN